MSTSKTFAAGVAAIAIVAAGVVAYYMIDIDQTREARLPNVDVTVEGGQAPAFDVKTGSVDVGTTTETVKVPDVEVKMEEKKVEVPTISVTPAPAD
jgi:hypothetical protein